ncbi:cyclopropane-fatty-acyl-phospholipid synthase family protein [Bacteriovorax sp. PP10]|uniref:Cyclopropane-fatty-acyl-phospholipid synthase family protein n=1 Tax=Bacteriovorax antarcticus TaxID=3088717 RepID=A0ABU5VS96_9BACT|nr:cyclopropane-fatty-acyl-phospholipid synthase family protein [Bacteriovorax sp. PP10]MEA9355876.1 cyclopropane-fatty-acyl-phospholipid synthase family protein [Bacteriovorax sp. PP10]
MNELLVKNFIKVLENGYMPDPITRVGIRSLVKARLHESFRETANDPQYLKNYAKKLKLSPLAIMTNEANKQHYEVPTAFYDLSLGRHKKYSSCYWDQDTKTLEEAEQKALDLSIEHAQVQDGMRVLELGCGWGSLSLELARRFPNSKIVAVSNSKTQKEYIDNQAISRGLENLTVLTRDLGLESNYDFGTEKFDRVMSIEMMEHLRNYELFFKSLAPSIKDDGKFFIHIFTHKETPYFFETEGEDNWMGKYFFSGGQMPSRDLFDLFNNDLVVEKKWDWNGDHYSKTLEAWLDNTDQEKAQVLSMFKKTYGEGSEVIWYNRWRVFFMSCSELFKYNDGKEWGVTHYLMTKKK